ncbi:hypothetical protein CRG98_026586 [Punica granatum]|nr:hypothetical protein CRG98_026586 [Punica granatum]
MYASSGDLDSAVLVFGRTRNPNRLLYNSMVRAYSKYGCSKECAEVYRLMHKGGFFGDNFTFPFVLRCCADLRSLWMGKCVHGQSLRAGCDLDMYVGTSLIDMYVKCSDLGDARQVFEEMPYRDASSWNALINGYMKVGKVSLAKELFQAMPCKNIVSWTAMVSGYTQNGLGEEALGVFYEMLREESEIKPNWVTIMSVLPACTHSAALERGRKIHDYARQIGLDSNPSVRIALIGMYARCGSLDEARCCFDKLHGNEKNSVAWNTIITGYASHGRGEDCVFTFEEMVRNGVKPDSVTFTGLLSGCSHSGLTDVGLKYFDSMSRVFSVEPRIEHYACVVDLLGRAGRLVEAKDLIDRMPMEAGASIWGALLAACRKNRNLELAELAVRKLFVIEPENTGNYVLLSNMYAEAGMWKEVNSLRNIVKSLGMKKSPGCSWIEIDGKAHLFLGGDTSHPQSREIYLFLEALPNKIKSQGYMPNTTFALHDVSEEEKEHNLNTHSEKLAVAFGILNTEPGAVLRVTKNLRICGDCHTVIKFVSRIYEREIVVRDVSRFHHFKDGSCSCGDYW